MEQNDKKYMQLSAIADEVGVFYTTVNSWFKRLEDENIHHVMRNESGHRVYDSDDLAIARFIKEKSQGNEKFKLKAIFRVMQDEKFPIPLRPKPIDESQELDSGQMQISLKQAESRLLDRFQSEIDELQVRIESYLSNLEERNNAKLKTLHLLEQEALESWIMLPENERFIKQGWFKRVEDISKRDLYIKKYVNERINEVLKLE